MLKDKLVVFVKSSQPTDGGKILRSSKVKCTLSIKSIKLYFTCMRILYTLGQLIIRMSQKKKKKKKNVGVWLLCSLQSNQ